MFNTKNINLPISKLYEISTTRGEGIFTSTGALRVTTGKYTGRSPNDKFIVKDASNENEIWWDNNAPISEENFNKLYQKITAYLQNKGEDVFIFEGYAGADQKHTLPVKFVNEFAWQNIFVQQLFLRKHDTNWPSIDKEGFTVLVAPGCKAVPEQDGTNSEAFVVINFAKKIVIIGGTYYAGEMKKSIFSVINYLLPKQNILSMHCSANQGKKGDVALFFGLSGTGKTTLSADPNRNLIGDDEHAWTDEGIFNIEGGCYAKCINLSKENEPQIWDAIKFGTIVENVVLDENRHIDFDSDELTENTRAAYSVHSIPNSIYPGLGNIPTTVVFLTADAFGVLPPVAKLSPEQAMYYFMSGYTSKLAGTERGITEPQATFSACFGSPFLPLHPITYANLLKDKINKHQTSVYLINTGWQGGKYGTGKRISIADTRSIVSAALSGALDSVNYENHNVFNLQIPTSCPGVKSEILNPENTWANKEAYLETAKNLANMFHKNFQKYATNNPELTKFGPHI